jgi:hypothetical protein
MKSGGQREPEVSSANVHSEARAAAERGKPEQAFFSQEHRPRKRVRRLEKKLALGGFTRQKWVVRMIIGSKAIKLLVRFAVVDCRNQPGEKSELKIAGQPIPSRREGSNTMSAAPQQEQESSLEVGSREYSSGERGDAFSRNTRKKSSLALERITDLRFLRNLSRRQWQRLRIFEPEEKLRFR